MEAHDLYDKNQIKYYKDVDEPHQKPIILKSDQ